MLAEVETDFRYTICFNAPRDQGANQPFHDRDACFKELERLLAPSVDLRIDS